MRFAPVGFGALIFALVLSGLPAPAPAELVVRLGERAAVPGGPRTMRLDEVASVRGAGTDPQRGLLGRLLVGRAPRAGESAVLTREALALRMRDEGLDTAEIRWEGAESVTVTGVWAAGAGSISDTATTVDADLARRCRYAAPQRLELPAALAARKALRAALGAGRLHVAILRIRTEADLSSSHHGADLRVEMPGTPFRFGPGSVRVAGRVLGSGFDRGGILVECRVTLSRRPPAARRRLPADRRSQEDANRPETAAARRGAGAVEAGGWRLEAGKDMPRGVLVRAGDEVTVHLRSGNLSVTSRGIARQAGARGARVRVENIRSKRIFRAIVSGKGQLTMEDAAQ